MARDGAGIDVELDRVPLREDDLEPWEIMISESQERMVAVVRPGGVAVGEVCDRWELAWAVIGAVTDTGELRALHDGEVVGAIPSALLTDACPRYEVDREPRPGSPRPARPPCSLREALFAPNVAPLLGLPAVRPPRRLANGAPARARRGRAAPDAVVPRGSPCRSTAAARRARPVPRRRRAVLEAARNVACAGGRPLALTDCLNFGNPEKPEIGWELAQAIEGMSQAAEALGVPVVSGNVSLYNETDGRPIPPTPVVGCVGLVPDVRRIPARWRDGDVVLLAEAPPADLDGQAALVAVPLAERTAPVARTRRRRRRARRGAGAGGALERHRRASTLPDDARRRPGWSPAPPEVVRGSRTS